MDIKEVERLLKMGGFFTQLFLPKHIILIDEPVTENFSHQLVHYAGLQPKWRKDIIIITSLGNSETLFHEWAHTLGFAEFGANIIGKLMDRRVRRGRILPRLFEPNFTYEEAPSPSPKLKHYVLKIKGGEKK